MSRSEGRDGRPRADGKQHVETRSARWVAARWWRAACRDEEGGRGGRVRDGAELVLRPVRGQPLRYVLRSRSGGAEAFLYDRAWAAQRTPLQLRSRSIAAPGRAPRLGFVSCTRSLCTPVRQQSESPSGAPGWRPRAGPLRGGNVVPLENQDMRDGPTSWSGVAARVCGVPRRRSRASVTCGSMGATFRERC